jgi:hypothetical protein
MRKPMVIFYRVIGIINSLLILSLLISASTADAQERSGDEEEAEIETDRDSFTPATSIVGRGRLILESAYSFIDNDRSYETHGLPELLIRYGLSENFELRFGWNYEIGSVGSPISGSFLEEGEEGELEEEARVLYGGKFFLTEQDGWLPKSSFILQGYTPTMGESNLTSLSTTYAMGWTLQNAWTWDSAMRFSTAGANEDLFNVWAPSTVIKIPMGERWKTHAEYFGVFSDGRETETKQHFFSPGIHYLINRDVEVGVRVGWGLNEAAPDFFSNVGIGWQF